MIRAMRNRYLARSEPGSADHFTKALRAAPTARSTSSAPARATSDRTSSVLGLTVLKTLPSAASVNSPSTKSPYDGAMSTTERDSGAGAYSNAEAMMDQSTVT